MTRQVACAKSLAAYCAPSDALEKVARGDAESLRELGHGGHAWIALSGLEQGDGISVHPGALRERLLREAGLLSGSP